MTDKRGRGNTKRAMENSRDSGRKRRRGNDSEIESGDTMTLRHESRDDRRNDRQEPEVEQLDLLAGVSGRQSDMQAGTGKTGNKYGIVDFETLIRESLGNDLQPPLPTPGKTNAVSQSGTDQSQQSDLSQAFEHATPEMVRCGEDEIAFHVPESVKRKIRRHEFVNLAVLLKGGVELAELYGSTLLSINEKGQLETKPKSVTDKISSVDKWTDAFLIFSSIYLLEYPQKTQELLKYMSVIQEAASRSPWFQCRSYDEQFRLRQALQVQSWAVINSDLWLRCLSAKGPMQNQFPPPPSDHCDPENTCLPRF